MFNNINVSNINIDYDEQSEEYYNEKLQFFQKMVEQQPYNHIAYFNLGFQYQNDNRYQDARGCYLRALQLDPKHEDSLHNLGLVYSFQKLYPDAIKTLNKVLQFNPQHKQSLITLGLVYCSCKNYETSAQYYDKALKLDPENADIYCYVGMNIFEQDKYHQATKWFIKAISIDPQHASAYFNLGQSYFLMNRVQEALQCYLKAIQLESNQVQAYHNVGNILCNYLHKPGEAMNYFLKAIELDHSNILSLTGLARCCIQLNSINMAAMYFSQAKKLTSIPQSQYQAYFAQNWITQQNFKFIQSSIILFELNYGSLNELKQEFSSDKKVLELINIKQMGIYQPLVHLIQEQLKPSSVQINKNNPNQKRTNQIQIIREQMNRRMELLELQARILTKKVKSLQKHMARKQEIDLIYQQLSRRTLQTEKKIRKLHDYFGPHYQLSEKLQQLKNNNMQKSSKFGLTLFWILNTQISSYRMINQGMVQRREQTQKDKVVDVIKKISMILKLSRQVPMIDQACQLINSLAQIFAQESQTLVIQRISAQFGEMWNDDRFLSNAISDMIYCLLQDDEYIKIIQEDKNVIANNKSHKLMELLEIIGETKDKLIPKIESFEHSIQNSEEAHVIADCCFIIKEIIFLNDKDRLKFKQIRKTDNFLLMIGDSLLKKRKNKKPSPTNNDAKKESLDIVVKGKKENQGSKCTCLLI